MKTKICSVAVCSLMVISFAWGTTSFVYEGTLVHEGHRATGVFSFEFRLFDQPTDGTLLAAVTRNGVDVEEGSFSIELDFGLDDASCQPGWLETWVSSGDSRGLIKLEPRKALEERQDCSVDGNLEVSGRLGLDTSYPIAKAHIRHPAYWFGDGCDGCSGLVIEGTGSANAASVLELMTDVDQEFDIGLYTSGATPPGAAFINNRNHAPMMFYTNDQMRLFLDKDGPVGIGTYTPQQALDVAGDLRLSDGSSFVEFRHDGGTLTFNSSSNMGPFFPVKFYGNGSAYFQGSLNALVPTLSSVTGTLCYTDNLVGADEIGACTSRREFKQFIRPSELGLDVVGLLKPVEFTWKSSGEEDLGFIVEEVDNVNPLLVSHGKDGTVVGINSLQMTAVLVRAVQEQQQIIERNEIELARLREEVKRLRTMEDRLSQVEAQLSSTAQ